MTELSLDELAARNREPDHLCQTCGHRNAAHIGPDRRCSACRRCSTGYDPMTEDEWVRVIGSMVDGVDRG